MKYVIIVYAAGFIVNLINPDFYYTWLMLDIDKLLRGQVWRLFTFVIQPITESVLWTALMLYVYYSIGTALERVWGSFRFNLFYFSGIIFNIFAVIIIYVGCKLFYGIGYSYPISLTYINLSLFLAFALMFPETRFFLMFFIPVKAKYMSIFYVIILVYDVFSAFSASKILGFCVLMSTVASFANCVVVFFSNRKYLSPRNIKRRMDFQRSYTEGMRASVDPSTSNSQGKPITRHKCAVCGRTELDGDDLEFRFCSKCNGNYEYCQDHLFTHEHRS